MNKQSLPAHFTLPQEVHTALVGLIQWYNSTPTKVMGFDNNQLVFEKVTELYHDSSGALFDDFVVEDVPNTDTCYYVTIDMFDQQLFITFIVDGQEVNVPIVFASN